jgi:hypothetical protein
VTGWPASRSRPKKGSHTARGRVIASGTGRATTRGSGEVIELECGVTVHPAREEQGRWKAVWYENGQRRQCEAASEAKLAAGLEKVAERLAVGAPNLERVPGQPAAGQGALAGRRPPATRVIAVDRKVIEVAGRLYLEAPKNRKYRRTIYPRRTPAGYPLAGGCAGEMRGDERTGRL